MNKKYLTLLVFAFALQTVAFTQQWNDTNAMPAGRYDDIYFHNDSLGWAVNGAGLILKTENGGDTWTEVYSNSSLYFRSVNFLDENIGFVGALDETFLKTVDGGISWTDIQELIPTPIPGICGLSHVGDNVYGVGVFTHPAYFIKSTDQGLSWTYSDLSGFADGLVECHFVDANLGFISGIKQNSGGVILKTTDGGDTWIEVLDTENGVEYIWKLDFVTDQVAYGSVETLGGNFPSSIVKTIDGGDNWVRLQVDSFFLDLQGIGFINQDTGWVGPRSVPMYETTDGGLTWNSIPTLYPNINRFFRINSNLIYAAGSSVYKYGDGIVSTRIEPALINQHAISSITPNPFSNQLSFTVEIGRRTNTRLDLINASGQHIVNIYAGRMQEGEHQFSLAPQTVNRITNGTYYLILRTNEGFLSVPVIKGGRE